MAPTSDLTHEVAAALDGFRRELAGRCVDRVVFAEPPGNRINGWRKMWSFLTTKMTVSQWRWIERNANAPEVRRVPEDAELFAALLNDFSLLKLPPLAKQGFDDALADFRRQANELQLEGLL